MKKYFYDLHIHSCLSPCADNDNTPNNIVGMAHLSGINILALTDHNTAKNCPAFFDAAARYGIVPIAGMEVTTSEDIHVVCLFEKLNSAMEFDRYLQDRRTLIKNKPQIFGDQLILDGNDNIIGIEEFLLPNATSISITELPTITKEFDGICYPAHIDRDANGIIAILGTIPDTPYFNCYEIKSKEKATSYIDKYSLHDKMIIISSDAHYLTDIDETESYFELECESENAENIRHSLFEILR